MEPTCYLAQKLKQMRTKTFLELLTLSSNLYMIAKDTEALDKIKEYSERGKDAINDFVKEKITDEDGNELEFVDKMLLKLHELKEELDAKIAEGVETAYEKMRIAHTNDIKALNEKVDALTKELSLAQSRLDALEAK